MIDARGIVLPKKYVSAKGDNTWAKEKDVPVEILRKVLYAYADGNTDALAVFKDAMDEKFKNGNVEATTGRKWNSVNASINMHPWNALVHHTIEPATGRYPAYHRTLQKTQDMTATAPYPGDASAAMRTYHALLGVPLDPIGCHGQEQKKKKKKEPRMDADLPVGMEPPADLDVPRMIPIEAARSRSRSRSRGRKGKKSGRSPSPSMERTETVDAEVILAHHLLPDTADLF